MSTEFKPEPILPFEESFYTNESVFRNLPLWRDKYIYLCHLSDEETESYLELCKDDPYEVIKAEQREQLWYDARKYRFTSSNACNCMGHYYKGTAFDSIKAKYEPRVDNPNMADGRKNEAVGLSRYEEREQYRLKESFENHLKSSENPNSFLIHRKCKIPLHKDEYGQFKCPKLKVVSTGLAIDKEDPHTGGSNDANVEIDGIVYWCVELKYPSEEQGNQPYLLMPFYYVDQVYKNLYITKQYHPQTQFKDFVVFSKRHPSTHQRFDFNDEYFYGQLKPMEHRYYFLLLLPAIVYKQQFQSLYPPSEPKVAKPYERKAVRVVL
jgi:hypothetical protein